MRYNYERISVLEAISRIAEIHGYQNNGLARAMLVKALRRGEIKLIEQSDGRYQEREFSDLRDEFARYGKTEEQFVEAICDDGTVMNLMKVPPMAIRIRPPKWFVNWGKLKEIVTPKDLGGRKGFEYRQEVKEALRKHLLAISYKFDGTKAPAVLIKWCYEFMRVNGYEAPESPSTVEGWVKAVLEDYRQAE